MEFIYFLYLFGYFDLDYPPPGKFGWLSILDLPGGMEVSILQTTATDSLMIAGKRLKQAVVVCHCLLEFDGKLMVWAGIRGDRIIGLICENLNAGRYLNMMQEEILLSLLNKEVDYPVYFQ